MREGKYIIDHTQTLRQELETTLYLMNTWTLNLYMTEDQHQSLNMYIFTGLAPSIYIVKLEVRPHRWCQEILGLIHDFSHFILVLKHF